MSYHRRQRKFGRTRDGRRALLRSLARSLIRYGQIETTTARAKELRPLIERLVTYSKTDNLAGKRLVRARLGGAATEVKKLFEELAPRYQGRAGGYTRIVKLPARAGDGSPLAIIQFV